MKINKNQLFYILLKYMLCIYILLFFFSRSVTYKLYKISYNTTYNDHVVKLDQLLIQDINGRVKPFHTLSLELLRKVYQKDHIFGFNANYWLLSVLQEGWYINKYHREFIGWIHTPFIKVDKILQNKQFSVLKYNSLGYTSLSNVLVLDSANNKISVVFENEYIKAFNKNPKYRNKYDKAIIKLTERIFIVMNILDGRYLKCIPLAHHPNKLWIGGWNNTQELGLYHLDDYFFSLSKSQIYNNYKFADKYLNVISSYQYMYSKSIIPSKSKTILEILYNKLNIFYNLIYLYFLEVIICLLFSIVMMINPKLLIVNFLSEICVIFVWIIFILHSLGLILRGYISCHAPWVNGYESAVFISWSIILSSLYYITKYKNTFIPFVSSLAASMLLMIANSNLMNPEITNIAPVLNSYWLIIHVFIIISSYGCLIFGSLLGLFSLIIYYIKKQFNYNISYTFIKQLTIINELSLILGLVLLIIGTFLGGVWANESWGSYWSWDPKETWALITIMIYAFVLHSRFIPYFNQDKIFNLLSCLSIFSVFITYFGVNYYLSGLHSYGKGDMYEINWYNSLYYVIIFISFIIIINLIIYCLRNKSQDSV
jgi:cytochrome c-type biogenesis protein CcsB